MQYVEGCAGLAGTEPHAWETGRMDSITYVGLDVHKATVSGGGFRERPWRRDLPAWHFENRPEVLSKLAARLSNKNYRISFCYEAGPCEYRLLTGYGHDCVVVALSLIPVKAG